MPDSPASQARQALLEAEAILYYLIKSKAANDENADVIVESLASSAKKKIASAIEKLPQ